MKWIKLLLMIARLVSLQEPAQAAAEAAARDVAMGRWDEVAEIRNILEIPAGFTYLEYYLARGMKVDDFAPNFSYFFSYKFEYLCQKF